MAAAYKASLVDKNDIVPFIWWGNAANPARFVLEGAQLHADLHSGLIPNSVFAINNDGFVAGAYTGANGLVGFVERTRSCPS